MSILRLKKVNSDKINTPEGFKKAYDTYSDKLFGMCIKRVGHVDIAKDIVQEVFKSLWEKRNTLKPDGSLENYLITATKYKLIDYYRRTQRNQTVEIRETELSTDTSFEEKLVFEEVKHKAINAIRSLPSKAREVFLLSRNHGLTNKQIAIQLSISEKTVEYHMSRALKVMKHHLK
ncbi:MAG: RNA polymerase sigma-70 factor [Bacteroidota bacterium]